MDYNTNCGIYKITNVVNGKYYIGSSIKLSGRIARHKRELKNNIHPNSKLQRSWNKYGESNFTFEILLLCDEEKLLKTEQEYLDLGFSKEPTKLFNIAKNSIAPMLGLPGPNKGKKMSKETRAKMSAYRMGKVSPNKGNKFSLESRLKMSEDRKGNISGEKNPSAKLTKKDVDKIRSMYLSGDYNHREISEIMNISRINVTNIVNNKRWYCEEYEQMKSAN